MNALFQCPLCASNALRTRKTYRFSKPPRAAYADCTDYVQRRLWLTFRVMEGDRTAVEFGLIHCQDCDLLFTNPRFDDAEIQEKYAYLVEHGGTAQEYAAAPVTRHVERARRIYQLVDRHRETESDAMAVADLGGQFGHNLSAFDAKRYRKYVIDFERYDLYDDLIYVAPDFLPCEERFDIVLANHVVEHLPHPANVVAKAAASLKPGGLMYLEVPLGAFREAYSIREPITHCNFFSERSLCRLAEMAGLVPVLLEARYQWVTHHAEWCINLVARKCTAESALARTAMTAEEARGNARFYRRLVAGRLHDRVMGLASSARSRLGA